MEVQFGGNLQDEFKVFDGNTEDMREFLQTKGNTAYVKNTSGDLYLTFLEVTDGYDEDEDGNEIETEDIVMAYEYGVFGEYGEEFRLEKGDIVYPLKWVSKVVPSLDDVL